MTEAKVWHEGKAYWQGPHNCLVPWVMNTCAAADGINTLYRSGGETEMMNMDNPPTKEEWLALHTYRDATGRFVYKEPWTAK